MQNLELRLRFYTIFIYGIGLGSSLMNSFNPKYQEHAYLFNIAIGLYLLISYLHIEGFIERVQEKIKEKIMYIDVKKKTWRW